MKDTEEKNGTDLKGFAGHSVTLSNEIDDEITRIGRGTPAGEYLRRYWPVSYTHLTLPTNREV